MIAPPAEDFPFFFGIGRKRLLDHPPVRHGVVGPEQRRDDGQKPVARRLCQRRLANDVRQPEPLEDTKCPFRLVTNNGSSGTSGKPASSLRSQSRHAVDQVSAISSASPGHCPRQCLHRPSERPPWPDPSCPARRQPEDDIRAGSNRHPVSAGRIRRIVVHDCQHVSQWLHASGSLRIPALKHRHVDRLQSDVLRAPRPSGADPITASLRHSFVPSPIRPNIDKQSGISRNSARERANGCRRTFT